MRHGIRTLCATLAVAGAIVPAAAVETASAASAPILHLGVRGARVSDVQHLLHIRANRLYDRRTYLAVRRFQANHHLLVDGQVGPQTWGALHHTVHATPARHASGGILRLGVRGTRVSAVQRLLHIRANGLYDRRTFLAVRRFQAGRHLLVDGQVGPQTWAAMHRAPARRPARPHRVRGSANGLLVLGVRGPRVSDVQRQLHIRANGLYDRRTYRAVRAFQARHGLTVDGQVGAFTWGALHRSGGRPPTVSAPLELRALWMARQYVGVPYVWGGTTPRGFDCSGLIWYAYGRLGVTIPRVTYGQWQIGHHVARGDLRPGDLVFFHNRGHVGIWIGHGWFLHAPMTGERVHATRFAGWYVTHYDGAVRIG